MIPVGLIGTSWWSENMFLASLKDHPQGKIVALCGRKREYTQQIADKWNVPNVYTDYNALIDSGTVQALIVATPNNSHFPIVMKALEAGLHVVCEKPMGLNYAEAKRMAEVAERQQVVTLVPFTWCFMPTARYLKELLDSDYIGQPYHLNLRWYTNFGRGPHYQWRYDQTIAGAGGVVGDLGAHFLHLAYWFFGEVASVSCQLGFLGQRPELDPDGKPYPIGDDNAIVTLTFKNGAQGVIHVSAMSHDTSSLGMSQHMELHGSKGSLFSMTDFEQVQRVSGARVDGEPLRELPIPDHIWQGARHETVFQTIEDVFYHQDFMTRQFISAIASNTRVKPDFNDGAYVQRLIDAAVKSHTEQRTVRLEEIS